MKIQFDTPLTGNDASTGAPVTLTEAQIAALVFTIFVDTVNPPIKSYAVPSANLANATTNANGSKHVSVDGVKDLGITVTPGIPYYIAIEDSLGNAISPETAVMTYTDIVTPGPVQNPMVA